LNLRQIIFANLDNPGYNMIITHRERQMKKKKAVRQHSEDSECQSFEWVNGEHLSADEYEARLTRQINRSAAAYLLKINRDCRWIFGLKN
jgi:hypothetical protein